MKREPNAFNDVLYIIFISHEILRNKIDKTQELNTISQCRNYHKVQLVTTNLL